MLQPSYDIQEWDALQCPMPKLDKTVHKQHIKQDDFELKRIVCYKINKRKIYCIYI